MVSKYLQLSNVLIEKIQKGIYPVKSKLPTEMELSAMYHVSRQTVRLALDVLVEKGMINKKQGSGNRVVSTGVERVVAIMISSVNDYIYAGILQDIQSCLYKSGYLSKIFTTQNKVSLEREAVKHIVDGSFAGVLAEGVKTALPNPNVDLYRHIIKNDVPLMFINGKCAGLENAVCVAEDNYTGGYQLTRYLISKGHECIGGVFKSDDIQGLDRYHGYAVALRDAGLTVPDDKLMWFSESDRETILNHDISLVKTFVKKRLAGCTALVIYNDEIAYQIILTLLEEGYALPESMSVVSFDNSYYSRLSPVKITSLGHESRQIGVTAANQLLRLMEGKEAKSMSIPWKLAERQSG